MRARPSDAVLDRIITAALAEDLGQAGDLTTAAVIPKGSTACARIVARCDLVVAGISIACGVFRHLDGQVAVDTAARDGEEASTGRILATIEGDAAVILTGERTALNLLGRMCGVATTTRAAVSEIAGTGAIILDTRKTMPGLRELDKYAVAAGGGTNHRIGLYDGIMIKDTHLGVTGSVACPPAMPRRSSPPRCGRWPSSGQRWMPGPAGRSWTTWILPLSGNASPSAKAGSSWKLPEDSDPGISVPWPKPVSITSASVG